MTDEEIETALDEIKADLHDLYVELEIEVPSLGERIRQVVQTKLGVVTVEEVKESGYPYPNEAFLANLTDEQTQAVTTFIDQVNATYDFTSMTDEEIEVVLDEIKADLHDLYDELGIQAPTLRERIKQGFRTGKDNTDNPSSSTEQDDEEFNNDSI
jgi:ribosomal protein L29